MVGFLLHVGAIVVSAIAHEPGAQLAGLVSAPHRSGDRMEEYQVVLILIDPGLMIGIGHGGPRLVS
jgi:hypothetical protein